MWVACKKLQPQLLWSSFHSRRLLLSSHSCSNGDVMSPAANISADVLHSLCMLAVNSQFCMWLLEQGLSCQPQKGIALGCKHFCHLLHWRLQPCQCHQRGIACDCSKCPEVDALSPEKMPGNTLSESIWASCDFLKRFFLQSNPHYNKHRATFTII